MLSFLPVVSDSLKIFTRVFSLPAQNTKDQVEHEKRANHYQGNEENPVEHAA